MIIKR